MADMTDSESLKLRQQIRAVLNSSDATSGCDALVLYFKGTPQGISMGSLAISSPPGIHEVASYLVQYSSGAAYLLGVKDGKELTTKT